MHIFHHQKGAAKIVLRTTVESIGKLHFSLDALTLSRILVRRKLLRMRWKYGYI
jgi:hypothetical protein